MTDTSFHDQVRIVPYREAWTQRFRTAKELIIAILLTSNIECDVRHVGGTAIPGMCSKPIVDVLVMVAPGDLEQAAPALAEHIPCLGECGRPGRFFISYGDSVTFTPWLWQRADNAFCIAHTSPCLPHVRALASRS